MGIGGAVLDALQLDAGSVDEDLRSAIAALDGSCDGLEDLTDFPSPSTFFLSPGPPGLNDGALTAAAAAAAQPVGKGGAGDFGDFGDFGLELPNMDMGMGDGSDGSDGMDVAAAAVPDVADREAPSPSDDDVPTFMDMAQAAYRRAALTSRALLVDASVQKLAVALANDPQAMELAKTLCKPPIRVVVKPALSKKRKKKVAVVVKDDKYWEKRKKNTLAAKKNREKLKQKKLLEQAQESARKELLHRTGTHGYNLLLDAMGVRSF